MTRALLVAFAVGVAAANAQSSVSYVPFGDARPILQALRPELLPTALRGTSAGELQMAWPSWVSRRDADIRARLALGDEDSIVNFLLFGVTFTQQPRITERDIDAGLAAVRAIVDARIKDLTEAAARPARDERLDFVRAVAQRNGIVPETSAGKDALQQHLRDQLARFLMDREAIAARAVSTARKAATDPSAAAPEAGMLFSERGLSSDTTIYIDFGIDAALEAIKANRLLAPGGARNVAIVGPGLDFTDKREGYDFYPPQTLQPFALIDSLKRLGLAARDLRLTAFDVSPRINGHIEAARERAVRGAGYVLQLPRERAFVWNPLLVTYWQQLGGQIGAPVMPAAAPPGIDMRAVRVRPEVVRSIRAQDLDIVLQRLEPAAIGGRYDVIVATNILVYYDVFEQSLAMANVAAMLKRGGLLLTNSPVFELPATPMRSVGFTDVLYEQRDAARDRVFWYQRQ